MAHHAAKTIWFGALCGLAWAAGFRAWMSEIAGSNSRVDGVGTIGAIIVPGAIVGGLLGWAEVIRRGGGRRWWRALALAPLAFAVAPLLRPGAWASLVSEGLGGGAVGVAIIAIVGGFSVSGRGRRWARIACGIVAAVLIGALTVATFFIGGPRLAVTEPRGIWVALIAASFLTLLVHAASIPFRHIVSGDPAAN